MRELNRVAIVDHLSAGGVSRFLLALITHIAALYPDTHFVYYVSHTNIERDDLEAKLDPIPNVSIRPLDSPIQPQPEAEPQPERGPLWTVPVGVLKSIPPLHKALLRAYVFIKELIWPPPQAWWKYRMPDDIVSELGEFDVVYFGWPYFTEPVRIPTAIVATFHDFHFRRFPEAYADEHRRLIERETTDWLRRCRTAVTSTKFIRDELLEYYPRAAPPIEVIYLAPYGFHRSDREAIEKVVARLGIKRPYALFSGGRSSHKNVAMVFEAVGRLKEQGVPVHLAITGAGSDDVGRESDADRSDPIHKMNATIKRYGMVRGEDFHALGYVSNADVDALTSGADVVVSASLYEAGCGPAMDAWQAGVAVAFSNIPPFLEQMERFGPEAWVFDPYDPDDIAEKIRSAIYETERSRSMVEKSLEAFAVYNWDDVAREYYRVLAEAAEAGPTKRALTHPSRLRAFIARRKKERT